MNNRFQLDKMRNFHHHLLLSATDLTRFTVCRHATSLDLAYLRGEAMVNQLNKVQKTCA